MNPLPSTAAELQIHLAPLTDMIGYDFQDIHILWEALQAAGSPIVMTGGRRIIDGNKRLALIGDAAIKTELLEQCYDQALLKGEASARLQQNLSNANLAMVGETRGLDHYIHLNNNHVGQASTMMIATAVQAVAGAAYKDGGMDAVRTLITTLGLNG